MTGLAKRRFLEDKIFHGLRNLNDGFDTLSISYFSEEDFAVVLDRAAQFNLGIYGIEPWLNGKFYDVLTYKDFEKEPTDESWYRLAFEQFKSLNQELQYAASYYIPDI